MDFGILSLAAVVLATLFPQGALDSLVGGVRSAPFRAEALALAEDGRAQVSQDFQDREDDGAKSRLTSADAFGDAEIEEETLPTVEDLAFPELEGDFDGDGAVDMARARESDMGVQIALELSTTGETYVEPLGADSLHSVDWRVVGPEELLTICDNPIDCPTTDGIGDARDVIFVILDGRDQFILHWNGGALETYFVDS